MNFYSVISDLTPLFLWTVGVLFLSAFGVAKPYLALGIFTLAFLLSIFAGVNWSTTAMFFPVLVAVTGMLVMTIRFVYLAIVSYFGLVVSFRYLPICR